MDIMLQRHNAKHVCDVPDGLRELCADISREVIRCVPEDIYCFVADYLNTLLITRENAKVAIKVVQNVVLKSQQIVEILSGTGIKLEKIAAAAPCLQKAFRAYLDAVDRQKKECGCDADSEVDSEYELSICKILEETGATYKQAYCAAIKIQALFRGHYERMRLAEKRGEVQWQRAAANTMEILRKSGITRDEATHAAVVIQSVYRGYYTRKNLQRQQRASVYERGAAIEDAFDINAWLNMMHENSGLTLERANEAATLIQGAFRKHLKRRSTPLETGLSWSKTSRARSEKLDEFSVDEVTSAAKQSASANTDPSRDMRHIKSFDDSDGDYQSVKLKSNVAISVGSGASLEKANDEKSADGVKSEVASKKEAASEKIEDDIELADGDEKSVLAELEDDDGDDVSQGQGENDDDEAEV